MRILVTNDDGVDAPGLAALTREVLRWSAGLPAAPDPVEIVVVAPLANFSGASAAVGAVYEREEIPFVTAAVEGAPGVPAYGIDGSPALAVIIGALGGFGPRPDLVLSGINHGVNVGRSVLHSGTIGAVLAGAQLGLRGMAVSMRSGTVPPEWGAAARAAVALLPALSRTPPRTVWNLNTPSVPFEDLRGVRRGRISTAGIIKAAGDGPATSVHPLGGAPGEPPGALARFMAGPERAAPGTWGAIRLRLGAAIPTLGDVHDEDPEDDGALVAAGFGSLTPLSGVREDASVTVDEAVRDGLDALAADLAAARKEP